MPAPESFDEDQELLSFGADLEPGTVLDAYRRGLFPMPVEVPAEFSGTGLPVDAIGWWSPNPRGVLRPSEFHQSRSLARAQRRYSVTEDQAFSEVVAGCADPTREHGWIDDAFIAMYDVLHELGWAHSIEVWSTTTAATTSTSLAEASQSRRELAGGLFGIEIGGLFCAESMFHRQRDASKVAVGHLCERLASADAGSQRLIDVQWETPHLRSLGVAQWSRADYLAALPEVVALAPILTR